jgi:hypothetical protein
MGWRGKIGSAASIAAFGALVAVAPAQALTLGTTGFQGENNTGPCNSASGLMAAAQTATDASFDYAVPAGGGEITSWSFQTLTGTAGSPYGLLVVRPSGAGYTVVGGDNETVPASLPATATFSLANPIIVQAGDLLGVTLSSTEAVPCLLGGGVTTTADLISVGPTTGATGSSAGLTPVGVSGVLNVSANLVQAEDVGIAQHAVPSSITAGGAAVFVLAVTGGGPGNSAAAVTDTVPAGLSIVSVIAGSGTCTVSGQTVSCSVPAAPATIAVVVSATTAGTFANAAAVATALSDPNPANNTSSATLAVSAAPVQNPAPMCHTVSLSRVPLKVAKSVVGDLGCKVGKLTTKSSKSTPKGDVVSTSPGAGKTLALGTKVNIVSSSGKPKKKKHTKKS